MEEPVWLPLEALIDLQREQIEEHGGAPGLQDRKLLESALVRPRHKFVYDGPGATIPALAAAYGWSIARNHPFVDGNKRIAFIAIGVFLGLNGYYLDAREEDAFRVMTEVAEGSMAEPELAAWIEGHCLPE